MSRTRMLVSRAVATVARRYIAGPTLADALAAARRLGRPFTVGYWDAAGETPAQVAAAYADACATVGGSELDGYVSIKLPSLAHDAGVLARVADAARRSGTMLHFDSLAEDWAAETTELACRLAADGLAVGSTLPGRWSRSLRDAERLAAAGVRVRVVKGQWPGDIDPERGFIAVVDALAAAGAPTVAIATHAPGVAAESLRRLAASGAAVELELLYGLPTAGAERAARAAGVATRVYVPYGHAYLPYSIRQAARRPRLLWWLLRDALSGRN